MTAPESPLFPAFVLREIFLRAINIIHQSTQDIHRKRVEKEQQKKTVKPQKRKG